MQIDLTLWIFFVALIAYLYYSFGTLIKNTAQKMVELKLGFWILQASGFSCWLWGIVDNWGDLKSIILFVMGLIFAGYKLYNIHLDTSKKKIEYMDFRDDAREKRRHHLEETEMNKKLKDGKQDKNVDDSL